MLAGLKVKKLEDTETYTNALQLSGMTSHSVSGCDNSHSYANGMRELLLNTLSTSYQSNILATICQSFDHQLQFDSKIMKMH